MTNLLKAADAMAEALRRRLNEKVDQNVECDCSYCMAYRADEALLSAYEAAKREADPCKDGCQYAKDVGMTEHRCAGGCYYAENLP